MADKKPATAPTHTLKHLAAQLAEDHQLSKKQGEAILNDLVVLITKLLKKGDRVRMSGLGILQVRKRAAAWAATLRPASRSRSRLPRRSPSVPPRN